MTNTNNYPVTDPEIASDLINSAIAGALGLEPQNLPDGITCYSEWFSTNTAGEMMDPITDENATNAAALEWLEACQDGDYLDPADYETAQRARENLDPDTSGAREYENAQERN